MLALDDLHAVGNLSCLDVLAALCEYVPPGSQIAVASREEPALPLARWRTKGWLHEIGVTEAARALGACDHAQSDEGADSTVDAHAGV